MVTANGFSSEHTGDLPNDPFGPGWWVGSDGNWHSPDERFDPEVPNRNHPVRRVVVVLLALALIGATSAGVWGGVFSQQASSSSGPPLASLDTQVELAVSGPGTSGFGVTGVVSAVCHPPTSWSAGRTFSCDVYGSAKRKLGEYDATVKPTTSSGQWRWTGVWKPNRHSDVTAL